MKKYTPLILIVAMFSAFVMLSFSGPLSAPKEAEAGISDAVIYGLDKLWKTIDIVENAAFNTFCLGCQYWGKAAGSAAASATGFVVSEIGEFTFSVSGKLFMMAGKLMDYAIAFSVVNFSDNIKNIGIVNQGYKIVLNVANMIFIFILLYIAIGTILQINAGNIKKLLMNVIIVALFINFSLFMTKVIIDAGNILSMGFYNAIQTEIGETDDGQTIKSQGSIASTFMSGLRLQTIVQSKDSAAASKSEMKGYSYLELSLNFFGGSALLLVTAFVFLSVAILFIIRFIALLFYMILSPVAFLGFILPEMKEHSKKWWSGFQSQVIFAPVFLFMMYLVSSIINSGKLWDMVNAGSSVDKNSTFYNAIATGGATGFPIIMNYVILIGLLIGALITAKTAAAAGSHGAVGYAQKFQGWAQGVAGRQTLGRAAYMAGNSKIMDDFVLKHPSMGIFAQKQFGKVAGTSFGGVKGGYEKALKDKTKAYTDTAKRQAEREETKNRKTIQGMEDLKDRKMEDVNELEARVENAKRKYDKLADLASRSMSSADFDAADLAKDALDRESAILENNLFDINKFDQTINLIKKFQGRAQDKRKREFAKNIQFDSSLLNKLFPSGAGAAAEIRKKKSTGEKEVAELIEKLAKEKATASTATGGSGGTGGTGGGTTTSS